MTWLSNILSGNNKSTPLKKIGKAPAASHSSLAIIIDHHEYQVAELAVRSFRINPYDGDLIAKQCFYFTMVLTMNGQQGQSLGSGVVRANNGKEGLVAQFLGPSPVFDKNLMQHLAQIGTSYRATAWTALPTNTHIDHA